MCSCNLKISGNFSMQSLLSRYWWFFHLIFRFTQRSPVAFLQCAVIKAIICCAIAACSLDHKDANASVTKFLVDFIKTGRDKEVGGSVRKIIFFSQVSRCNNRHLHSFCFMQYVVLTCRKMPGLPVSLDILPVVPAKNSTLPGRSPFTQFCFKSIFNCFSKN